MKFIVCVFLFASSYACAQTQANDLKEFFSWISFTEDAYWVDGGYGAYTTADHNWGIAASYSVNLVSEGVAYQLRFVEQEEFVGILEQSDRQYNEFSFLMGVSFGSERWQWSALAGVGLILGEDSQAPRSDTWPYRIADPWRYGSDHYMCMAVPLHLGVQYKPYRLLGFGAAAVGSLSGQMPNYSFLLQVCIGRLR